MNDPGARLSISRYQNLPELINPSYPYFHITFVLKIKCFKINFTRKVSSEARLVSFHLDHTVSLKCLMRLLIWSGGRISIERPPAEKG